MFQTFSGFKIVAKIGRKGLKVAYKKSGFLYTIADRKFKGLTGGGFITPLDGITTHFVLQQDKQGEYYLLIHQPSKAEEIKLYFSSKADFKFFVETDEHGYFIIPK
jgi:hypothetical protein